MKTRNLIILLVLLSLSVVSNLFAQEHLSKKRIKSFSVLVEKRLYQKNSELYELFGRFVTDKFEMILNTITLMENIDKAPKENTLTAGEGGFSNNTPPLTKKQLSDKLDAYLFNFSRPYKSRDQIIFCMLMVHKGEISPYDKTTFIPLDEAYCALESCNVLDKMGLASKRDVADYFYNQGDMFSYYVDGIKKKKSKK